MMGCPSEFIFLVRASHILLLHNKEERAIKLLAKLH